MSDKRFLTWISFLMAGIFGYLETFRVELTNDTNFFMHCALRLWRFGAGELYNKCFDENFPFHMVFYAPLAAFSAQHHIPPSVVLHTVCCFTAVVSLFVLSRVLAREEVSASDRNLWLAIAALTLLVVPSCYGVFADREHFLFIFGMPWMVQMLLRLRPLPYSCLFAAPGFLMKPHDFALFGLMALTAGPSGQTLRQRVFSQSSLIIGGAGAVYLLGIVLFFPQYLLQVLPLSAVIYPTDYFSFDYKFLFAFKYYIIIAGIIVPFVRPLRMLVPWLGFVAGCSATLFLNAGWDYTFYLMAVPMMFSFITPWLDFYGKREERHKGMRKAVRLVFGIVMLLSAYSVCTEMNILPTTRFRNHTTVLPAVREAIREEAGDKMIILSPHVWNSQVEPFAGRPEAVFGYDNLWTYTWFAAHPGDPHSAEVGRLFTSNFLRAIEENPTAVIFEDVSQQLYDIHKGVLNFLAHDPSVGPVLKKYSLVKIIDFCDARVRKGCAFAVFRR